MPRDTPGRIFCRVVDVEGHPVAGARVFFVSGPGSFPDIAALTDGNGSAVLTAPSPGAYSVQVVADGFVPQTVTAIVAEQETTTQNIVLERS
ncbi:MAG: carboxypeptidase-like regulatory domain-containing protein [Thermomicrobiales bacterium]